jgi:hypothetical protein
LDCEFSEPVFFSFNAGFDLIYHALVCGVDSMNHLRLLFIKLIFKVLMKRDSFLEICKLKNRKKVTVCL